MITILTAPSPNFAYKVFRRVKDIVKVYIMKRELASFPGHYAVVRSLLAGLSKIGEPYVFNPAKFSEMTDHVHVLGGINTLKYALKLKKQNKIKRLTAGPNIVISSADHNGLIAAKEIDYYLVNSEWTMSAYLLDNPKLQGRIGIFPSGVDVNYWKLQKSITNPPIIAFYNKRPEPNLYNNCLNIASHYGFEVVEIEYGNYTHDEFKQVLKSVEVVVYFVEQESQGIALVEIWATDTPTYVWNPGYWQYNTKNYECCSAPYLTGQTGDFFRDTKEFHELILNIHSKKKAYSPCDWVENNLTDQLSASLFSKLIIKP